MLLLNILRKNFLSCDLVAMIRKQNKMDASGLQKQPPNFGGNDFWGGGTVGWGVGDG
jgi:hypothetical protein